VNAEEGEPLVFVEGAVVEEKALFEGKTMMGAEDKLFRSQVLAS